MQYVFTILQFPEYHLFIIIWYPTTNFAFFLINKMFNWNLLSVPVDRKTKPRFHLDVPQIKSMNCLIRDFIVHLVFSELGYLDYY